MSADRPIPRRTDDDPASPPAAWPLSDCYKLIIGRCISFAKYVCLLMVIFLAILAGTLPELRLNPGSSPWSLNISISVEYTHMKLLSSIDGQLTLSCPSLVSPFTQGPGCLTSGRAKAQSRLAIFIDSGMNGLVSTLSGGEVTINMAVRVERRLRLGPWWVAVFDMDISFMALSFTAPSDGGGGGDWMILQGTLSCSLDIIPQLWFKWKLWLLSMHLGHNLGAFFF